MVSNLVRGVLLSGVNLLLRVPVDIRAVVVAVRGVLELSDDVLLIGSPHVGLAERGLVV